MFKQYESVYGSYAEFMIITGQKTVVLRIPSINTIIANIISAPPNLANRSMIDKID